jgi:hypothetical protein
MKSQKFFLSFMLTVVMVSLALPIFAHGETTPTAATVNYTEFFGTGNLKVQVTDNPAPGIRVQQSGMKLASVTNLGRSLVTGDPTSYIYSAALTYTFTINVFTSCSEAEAFSSAPRLEDWQSEYLKTYVAKQVEFPSLYPGIYRTYHMNYRNYVFPTTLGPKAVGYTGPVKVDVKFESTAPASDAFVAQGYTIQSTNYDARIIQQVVEKSKVTTIDTKTVNYSSSVTHSATQRDIIRTADPISSTVDDYLGSRSYGIQTVSSPIVGIGFRGNLGQGKAAPYTGNLNRIYVEMKPDVTLIQQRVEYGRIEMLAISTGHWAYTGKVENRWTTGVTPLTLTRNIGWRTMNYNNALQCKVVVQVDTTVNYASTTNVGEWDPTNPELVQGDLMWDDYINSGTYGETPELTKSVFDQGSNWFAEYWWILLLVGLLAAAYYVVFMSPLAFPIQARIMGYRPTK